MNYKCSKSFFFCFINEEGYVYFCFEYVFRGRYMEEFIVRDSFENRWRNSFRIVVSWVFRKAFLINFFFYKVILDIRVYITGSFLRYRVFLLRKISFIFNL